MPSEVEIIIAFVFNRSGRKQLTHSEFYLTLSIDLNWFTPDDAKEFLNKAIENKLLDADKNNVKPGFNTEEIKIPFGFFPSNNVLFEKTEKIEVKQEIKEDVFQKIIKKISSETKKDEKIIAGEIEKIARRKNIIKEVAAVLYSKEFNVFLDEYYENIEAKITS